MTFTMDLEEKQASDLDYNKCVCVGGWVGGEREGNEKKQFEKKN